jgi:hypothetical protein
VSLRLSYLIFWQVFGLVLLMGRTSAIKDVELLVLRHVWGSKTLHLPLTSGA